VTPLGWAPLLAPFAKPGPMAALTFAKYLGAGAWLASAGVWIRRIAGLGARALAVALIALAVTTPLAAWAVAGMETGLVLALTTFGLGLGNAGRGALGIAAALRPELLPWTFVLSVGDALLDRAQGPRRVRATVWALLAALGPFVSVALVRTWLFGAAYPLALVAKPPDADAGLRYALGALALSGPPFLLLAGRGLSRLSSRGRLLVLATLVHVAVIAMAGGDWMPFYRLFVPVLPGVIGAGAELAAASSLALTGLRAGLLVASAAVVAVGLGPSARRVGSQRAQLIAAAGPALRGAHHVATLDVGWVGAATSASIVDLAGVTDPRIARLPGGHTTKRLPDDLLEARDVDALVLLAERPDLRLWPDLRFARAVEARVVTLASAERFVPEKRIELAGTTQAYIIARRRPEVVVAPQDASSGLQAGFARGEQRLAE
jgi:hypothetical protein